MVIFHHRFDAAVRRAFEALPPLAGKPARKWPSSTRGRRLIVEAAFDAILGRGIPCPVFEPRPDDLSPEAEGLRDLRAGWDAGQAIGAEIRPIVPADRLALLRTAEGAIVRVEAKGGRAMDATIELALQGIPPRRYEGGRPSRKFLDGTDSPVGVVVGASRTAEIVNFGAARLRAFLLGEIGRAFEVVKFGGEK